jgi:hypothetical protein
MIEPQCDRRHELTKATRNFNSNGLGEVDILLLGMLAVSLSDADVEKIKEHLRTRLKRVRRVKAEKDPGPQVEVRRTGS